MVYLTEIFEMVTCGPRRLAACCCAVGVILATQSLPPPAAGSSSGRYPGRRKLSVTGASGRLLIGKVSLKKPEESDRAVATTKPSVAVTSTSERGCSLSA